MRIHLYPHPFPPQHPHLHLVALVQHLTDTILPPLGARKSPWPPRHSQTRHLLGCLIHALKPKVWSWLFLLRGWLLRKGMSEPKVQSVPVKPAHKNF